MKRLLCVIAGMGQGGAQSILMKIYRGIDREKYQMDFIVFSPKIGFYDKEIESMGGRMFYMPSIRHKTFNSLRYVHKVIRDNNYKYVLLSTESSLHTIILLVCKLAGAKVRAIRSTNTRTGRGYFFDIVHNIFDWLPNLVSNVRIAPSSEAAKYMFGNKSIKNNMAKIIKNGIPTEEFSYNQGIREMKRSELGIKNDELLMGNVGRMTEQKNQLFLLDVLNYIHEFRPNVKMLIVGDGPLRESIVKKINLYHLNDNVILLKNRKDVSALLMAMDIFVMPSLYEGMPNAAIEAQATGLKCILADSITSECKLIDDFEFVSLEKNIAEWGDIIIEKLDNRKENREEGTIKIKENGYDINDVRNDFLRTIFDYKYN